MVAISMFYDDASIQDLASAYGEGQISFEKLLQALGGSFKAEKKQRMGPTADFLGLVHDVSGAFSQGTVSFTPRPALITKATSMCSEALANDQLKPSAAGKLLGVRAFLGTGLFSRLGKVGQRSLIRRTYYDTKCKGWPLSIDGEDISLRSALDTTVIMLHAAPLRIMKLNAATRRPLIVASDAQASVDTVSAAFLVIDPEDGRRWGKFWRFNADDMEALGYPGFPMKDERRNNHQNRHRGHIHATSDQLNCGALMSK